MGEGGGRIRQEYSRQFIYHLAMVGGRAMLVSKASLQKGTEYGHEWRYTSPGGRENNIEE